MNQNTVTVNNVIDKDGLLLVQDKMRVLQGSSSEALKEHLRFAQLEQKDAEEAFTLIQQKRATLEAESSAALKRHLLKIHQVTLIERMLTNTEANDEENGVVIAVPTVRKSVLTSHIKTAYVLKFTVIR